MNAKEALIEYDLQVLLKGETAPDLTEQTMQRAAEGETPQLAEPRRYRPRMAWRRVAETAVIVLAVGLIAWIVAGPKQNPPEPERLWAAGPDSRVIETESGLRLESGWLLLKPGAPDVQSGESNLTEIRGLVLARARGQPSKQELENIQPWLQQNELEEEMLKGRNWAKGLAMAVLLFAGTAVLDGQEVEAPEAPAEPVWHVVQSVVDIENLPEGATHVRANGLNGAYLEFFQEVKGLEALDFRNGKILNASHLEAIAKVETLRHLDLRDCIWQPGATRDLRPLARMAALEWLGVAISPSATAKPDEPAEKTEDWQQLQLAPLGSLRKRGVVIPVSVFSNNSANLESVRDWLPDLEEITLNWAGDPALQVVSTFKSLQRLEIERCHATELGFAFLARGPKLKQLIILNIQGGLTQDMLHHISRIDSLEVLGINFTFGSAEGSAEESLFRPLFKMESLRELRLGHELTGSLTYGKVMNVQEHPLSGIGPLRSLKASTNAGWYSDPELLWSIAAGCATSELFASLEDASALGMQAFEAPEWWNDELAAHLQSIHLHLTSRVFSRSGLKTEPGTVGNGVLAALRKYPNLARIKLTWEGTAYGSGTSDNLDRVAEQLREAFPDLEVEVVK